MGHASGLLQFSSSTKDELTLFIHALTTRSSQNNPCIGSPQCSQLPSCQAVPNRASFNFNVPLRVYSAQYLHQVTAGMSTDVPTHRFRMNTFCSGFPLFILRSPRAYCSVQQDAGPAFSIRQRESSDAYPALYTVHFATPLEELYALNGASLVYQYRQLIKYR